MSKNATPHLFTNAADAAAYTLAGKATLTLSSVKTGARYTYKVRRADKGKGNVHFVTLLTGSDNETAYTYIGMIKGNAFVLTAKSKMTADAMPVKAFDFYTRHVVAAKHLPDCLEVRHNGHCGRCGRTLTVPESIDNGIGPECIKHIH